MFRKLWVKLAPFWYRYAPEKFIDYSDLSTDCEHQITKGEVVDWCLKCGEGVSFKKKDESKDV